jgi:hypothetical protein
MPKKQEPTTTVISRDMTWQAPGLPELTAGVPVSIPVSMLPQALGLQGVERVSSQPATPTE